MKTEFKQEAPVFTPITLTIRIESEYDAKMLHEIACMIASRDAVREAKSVGAISEETDINGLCKFGDDLIPNVLFRTLRESINDD